MFSKELENLIQATLEDGKLEENEKAALVKRAQREGVDLDELDIYINSLLQRRQRELNEKKEAIYEKYEEEKKKAIGPVCPKCGKQVPPLTLVCDCGYEFTNNRGESAVKKLFDQINDIQLTEAEIDSCSKVVTECVNRENRAVKDNNGNVIKKVDDKALQKLKEKKKLNLIQTFPVPNTKEDIIEFLALAAPNAKHKGGLWGTIPGRIIILAGIAVIVFILSLIFRPYDGFAFGCVGAACVAFYGGLSCIKEDDPIILQNKRADAWKAKFDQVLMKGRSLRGDSEFTQQLDYYENMLKKK